MKVSNNSKLSMMSSTKSSLSKSPKKIVKPIKEFEMFIDVIVKGSKSRIHCKGRQTFKWLQNVALHYYDEHFSLHTGKGFIMMTKDEVICNPADVIQKVFKDSGEINIMFLGKIVLN
jgi:hypothetical protein